MSEDTTQPVTVTVDKAALKAAAKAVQAEALVRRLGLERAVRAVATARKFAFASELNSGGTFSVEEVVDLLAVERVHLSADELAAAVRAQVAERLECLVLG
jgi:hypothetical protein